MATPNNNIPTRKNVHLRNPEARSAQPNKQVSPSPAKRAPASSAAGQGSTQKKPAVTAKAKPVSSGISAKKQQDAKQKRIIKEKYKQIKRQESLRKKAILKRRFKAYTTNFAIGVIIAALLFGIFSFLTYRDMSKFAVSLDNVTINFYKYLDENSEDEAIIKQLQARKNGEERPALILNESLYTNENGTYIPFSSISDYFNMTESGDKHSRTILIGSSEGEYTNENTATFFFDKNKVRVNGAEHYLKAGAFLKGKTLYISFDFFKSFADGLTIESSTDSERTVISVTQTKDSISFVSSLQDPLSPPNKESFIPDSKAEDDYGIDLSEYEKHINPADPDQYLILINLENKLDENYVPDDLTGLIHTRGDRETQKMRLDAAKALEAFLKAAYAAGHSDITVTSAYRSYTYQSSLFNTRYNQYRATYDEETALAKTAEFTAYPGSSEHQSGLCCDMHNLPSAMQSFANTEAYKWLYKHCADFGFILRYPKSKEEITGISYEPWHYRFVGRYHAQKIMESGLSLEEYIEGLQG